MSRYVTLGLALGILSIVTELCASCVVLLKYASVPLVLVRDKRKLLVEPKLGFGLDLVFVLPTNCGVRLDDTKVEYEGCDFCPVILLDALELAGAKALLIIIAKHCVFGE